MSQATNEEGCRERFLLYDRSNFAAVVVIVESASVCLWSASYSVLDLLASMFVSDPVS